jgi:hypothetical protein
MNVHTDILLNILRTSLTTATTTSSSSAAAAAKQHILFSSHEVLWKVRQLQRFCGKLAVTA